MGLIHDVGLGDESSMFKVAVSDKARGVVKGHQVVLDVSHEWLLPDVRVLKGVKEHTSHAWFGSVSGSQQCGLLGDNLSEVSQPKTEAGGQAGKVNDVGMQVPSDSDMVTLGLGEGQLQSAEQASRSRDGAGDEAELAQDVFPFLGADK